MQVLERVEQRESRIGAETSSVGPFPSFVSAVATLTAVVVVPTPPLAPMNANTDPAAACTRCPSSRAIAASNSACFSGCEMYSVTPARIPSSINAGSNASLITFEISTSLLEGAGFLRVSVENGDI